MARRRKTSLWRTLPVWAGVAALVGWGLWQAGEFRASLLEEIHEKDAQGDGENDPGVATQAAVAIAADSITREVPADAEADGGGMVVPVDVNLERVPYHMVPVKPLFDEALTAEQLAAMGAQLLSDGRIVEGRAALNAALERAKDEVFAGQLRETLRSLNASVFLGTAVLADDPFAHYVEIQPGDSFLRIGHEFGLTGDFVGMLNPQLNTNNLKVYTGVKVIEGPFKMRLARGESRIDLFVKDMYICSMQVELPEGNYLPKGEYRITSGSKLQMGSPLRTWIGFEGCDISNEDITGGWIYGAAGPRGSSAKDHATGIHVGESDLRLLYNVLVEYRSTLRVEP